MDWSFDEVTLLQSCGNVRLNNGLAHTIAHINQPGAGVITKTSERSGLGFKQSLSDPKVVWTWIIGLAVPLVLILLRATLLSWSVVGLMCGLSLCAAWVANSVWAAVLALKFVRSNRYIAAALVSIFPVLLLTSILTMPRGFWLVNRSGDELHFLVARHTYLAEIARAPNTTPKLMVFELGSAIGGSSAIIYDESDESGLSEDRRSYAWNDRAIGTLLSCPGTLMHPFLRFTGLTEHFYLASSTCW